MKAVEREASYAILFEKAPHPMWVCDRDSLAVLAVNEAAVRHYGYQRAEFLALNVRDLVPGAQLPGFLYFCRGEPPTSSEPLAEFPDFRPDRL